MSYERGKGQQCTVICIKGTCKFFHGVYITQDVF